MFLNQVILIGNLGTDPEVLKETKVGLFVRLQLATSKRYTDANKRIVTDTQWHTVYLSNGVGKYAASHFKKGDKILVVGELRKNSWQDKQGKTQYSIAVYAKECKALSANKRNKEDEGIPEEVDQENIPANEEIF